MSKKFDSDEEYWRWYDQKMSERIIRDCCKGGTPMFIENGDE